MPELPDISVYLHALSSRVLKQELKGIRFRSVFVLRSVDPPISVLSGRSVTELRRIGKRIVFVFGKSEPVFVVLHLMVAGRLRWSDKRNAGVPGKIGLCAFDFENGTLLLTEASQKKRTSIHLVDNEDNLADFDRGGLEIFDSELPEFSDRISLRNHTLKRALTNPSLFSGIGGSFVDEILHAARLSPVRLTQSLTEEEIESLFVACREVLGRWSAKLIAETADGWPKVTAFHKDMAVHGRFGEPCPVCDSPVQRIVYAERETNYCATCQNNGRLLADRSLSRLLKKDWPKTIEEWEDGRRA